MAPSILADAPELKTSLPHQAFCKALRGQRATIPNLYTLFPDWTPRFHPAWRKARDEVLDPWLERWVDEPQMRAKLQAANFTIFAAIVCADASFAKLCTVAKYFAWYFVWDDHMNPPIKHGRAAYQQASKAYFEHTLLGQGKRPGLSVFTTGQEKALRCWDGVGQHIRECCSRDVCEILLQTMLAFVASVDTVDSIYVADKVPSVGEYWVRRDLTAAVYPVIATLFFIHDATIPVSTLPDRDLSDLWKHTSHIVHITNDMLSMPKEARSYKLAKAEANGIRQIEERVGRDEGRKNVRELLRTVFLAGCKDVAMGLIHWSYHGERYFANSEIRKDYTIEFEL